MRSRTLTVAISLALALFTVLVGVTVAAAKQSSDQVCNATADYFLGKEDYSEAIATHQRVIAAHPGDALAHYHLGFAYGMTGDRNRELAEYRQAVALGLKQWDLYLNFGRVLLEGGDPAEAAQALNTAVQLAPQQPEPHFNLGLADERRGMLTAARDEMQISLRLDPRQPDAENMLGLIYAEERNYSRARKVWNDLARAEPDFEPARINLAILDRIMESPGNPPAAERHTFRTAFATDAN